MEMKIFTGLLILLCAISILLTESIKQVFKNMNKGYSANLIAAIVAIVAGGGGMVAAYIILSIPFTIVNIILILIMTIAIWMGSMIGYDKIIQLVEQIKNIK